MNDQQIIDTCNELLASSGRITVPQVAPLVASYRANDGHALHVVIDDGNVDDRTVDRCVRRATESGDVVGAMLARVLLRMTRTQRRRL